MADCPHCHVGLDWMDHAVSVQTITHGHFQITLDGQIAGFNREKATHSVLCGVCYHKLDDVLIAHGIKLDDSGQPYREEQCEP